MSDKEVEVKSISISGLHPVMHESTPVPGCMASAGQASAAAREREFTENSYSSIQFISDAAAFANMDETSYESVSTSAILRYCKMKVLKPYFRLLSILGWRPLISQNTLFENAYWARLINCTYVILILSLILTGYVLQFSSCYRQDGYRPYADTPSRAADDDQSGNDSLPNARRTCNQTYHSLVQADGMHATDLKLFIISAKDSLWADPWNKNSSNSNDTAYPEQSSLQSRANESLSREKQLDDQDEKKEDLRLLSNDGSESGDSGESVTAADPRNGRRERRERKREETVGDRESESEDAKDRGTEAETVTPAALTPYGLNAVPADMQCTPKCRGNFFALYLVPNLLHFIAYLCIWYLMRTPESEKLENLMERGFLQTTRTTGWMMAHKKLVSSLRRLIWMCLLWLLLSAVIHGMIVASRIQDLNLTWLKYGEPVKSLLIALTLASLTFNDLICGAIVTSYAVHCQLNISYIHNLCASIREKRIEFQEFYKRIEEAKKFLDYLNSEQALGLSLLLITIGCKLSVGVYALLASGEFNHWSLYAIVIVLLSLIFWSSLFAVPIIQAIRLTGACADLKKIGHEIRARPFGYQDTDQSDLDSLLLYTTNLSMDARILRVPVTSACTLIIVILFLIVFLMFGQLGLLNV